MPLKSVTRTLLISLSVFFSLATLALFVLFCWTSASDAQGPWVWIYGAPFLLLGSCLSLLPLWWAWPSLGARIALGAAILSAGVVFSFYGEILLGEGKYGNAVIKLVARTYERMTGRTPYDVAHDPRQ